MWCAWHINTNQVLPWHMMWSAWHMNTNQLLLWQYGWVGGEWTERLILHRQSTRTRFCQGSTVRWVANRRNVGFYWAGVGAVQPKGPMGDVSHGPHRNLAAGSPLVTPAGRGGGCPITDQRGRGGCCPSTDHRGRCGCCPSTDQ